MKKSNIAYFLFSLLPPLVLEKCCYLSNSFLSSDIPSCSTIVISVLIDDFANNLQLEASCFLLSTPQLLFTFTVQALT